MPIRYLRQSMLCQLRVWGKFALLVLAICLWGNNDLHAQGAATGATSTRNLEPARGASESMIRVKSKSSQSIAVLVNDDPITNYEIQQRQRLLGTRNKGMQSKAQAEFKSLIRSKQTTNRLKAILKETIEANKGKSRDEVVAIFEKRKKAYAKKLQKRAVANARNSILPELRKKALDELIDERLKLQAAKKLNVLASDDEVNAILKGIAERNKMTVPQFEKHLKSLGSSMYTMRARFKAMFSWRNVVRRQFGFQAQVSTGDVDRFMAKTTDQTHSATKLNVQKITLTWPLDANQAIKAQRLQQASQLAQSFKGCDQASNLTNSVNGARLEKLGKKVASSIAEPTRSMLLNAPDGQMLPPQVGAGGVELWIVCGREVDKKMASQGRTDATNALRQQELSMMGKRHLKDLRQDAHIEYR